MERMKTQVELLKECGDIKDAACVRYQKRIAELEEENKKLKEEIENHKQNIMQDELEIIPKLEEENKKLKEKNEKLEEDNINLISFNEHYSPDVIVKYEDRYETAYNEECIENAKLCDKMRRLEEENKKLNIKVASLEGEIKGLNSVIEKLKEENQTLELWLDNKEKLNEEYRDKIDLLNYQSYGPSELADSLYDANKTIEKLREEIKKIEKNQEYRYHRCMKAEKQYEHSMGEDDELIYEEGLYD